jgi:hypothetical protein
VEEILSPHLLLHEKYYIAHAKNLAAILAAMPPPPAKTRRGKK